MCGGGQMALWCFGGYGWLSPGAPVLDQRDMGRSWEADAPWRSSSTQKQSTPLEFPCWEKGFPAAAAAAKPTKQPRSNVSIQKKPKSTSTTKPVPDKGDKNQGEGDESKDDEGAEAGDNIHAHHAFWRDARMRKMQPMIEEGMRMNAYEGLQGYGGFMGGPDRAWSFLYDSPSARLTAAAFAPLWSAGVGLVRPMVLGPTEDMIRDQVDNSFNATEFVDSVSQAARVFFEAVAAEDSEALSKMCTPRATEALDRDRRRLREELGLLITRIDTQVGKASLAGANLWGPDSIRGFDPAWASDLSPNLSKSWLVVGVYLDVTLWVSYKRVGNSGERDSGGVGGSGAVWGQEARQEFQLPVRRWGTWFMARGPLPKGPAESLDCPWKLLAWC
ncbi:hypothetical protein VOLCADRAFT_116756 [Volvox carteri f. nagariensis]|uniref:Uncharacterized protein n=1 Tax=Volvox carteri f. nagariensis TaxID=3068 RepID=D8TPA2_VOLCA|nr:uncharacterized protein VOLCADRAFT_116756 [Volvox carteri f. nagariensis]EFJ50724.1 hypothetical protein VOLCADRAFT_116756 [Volvox carteri f. nagariensis]|eukprot:XP_002948317.1 hypothetical protein VOLCADRAFT_116756 [Volvox carteri f. nagariensis]